MDTKSPVAAKRERKNSSKLSPEQKVYVVKRLATYDSPTAIMRDLKDFFGVEVSVQAVNHYDPERVSKLAPYWKQLFWETRKAYLAACADVGTMEQTVRVRLREDMALMARDVGEYRTANELLDSIAKEAGAMFERRVFPSESKDAQPTPRMCTPDDRPTIVYQYPDGSIRDVTIGTPGGPLATVKLTDGEWPEQEPLPEKQLPEPGPSRE